MENIYDKAHEFAEVLKDCEEVVSYREVTKKVEKNETSKKMLDDFRKLQIEAYTEHVQNGDVSKETKEKMEKLGSVISMNPDVNEYLQAEYRFSMLWEDIMKILNDAIGIELMGDKE